MNNKGASKVRLILIIPILLLILLLILDTFINYLENKSIKKDTESILTEVLESDELEPEDYEYAIKTLLEKKKYDTDCLLIEIRRNEVYVENEHSYFGLFSSLRSYNVNTDEIKILGIKFKYITGFKKINHKYGEINILGVKFKVKRASKAFVRVTAKKNREGKVEFDYTNE